MKKRPGKSWRQFSLDNLWGFLLARKAVLRRKEVRDAMEAGGKPVTLGKRILRTETAGMTMLSILMYTLESV